ncbi:MAG: MlaD family protein [Saprospiraceae bacterium]|nr:MlaD family protein [Saprospiraceae bacterium]
MRRETKIGLLTIVSIGILIFGFKFLQGKNVFSNDIVVFAKYDNVSAILPSNPVYLDGYQVGIVADVKQNQETLRGYIVSINISSEIKLPKNTIAVIKSDLTGGKSISLEYVDNETQSNFLQDGDEIEGRTDGVLGTLIQKDDLSDYLQIVKDSILAITEGAGAASDFDLKKIMKSFEETMANINAITGSVNTMLNVQSSALNQALNNTKDLTAVATEKIAMLTNSMDSMVNKINHPDGVLDATTNRMNQLEGTLEELNTTVSNLNEVIVKLNEGQGTLGKLINEEEAYDNLNASLKELELLLEDFRVHPKRYTRVLSKKEIPYEETKD